MHKLVLVMTLLVVLCGCKRANFVDGCLFGERLGDELDWTRCALFVSGIGETGVEVDDSMVIVKSPLQPFAVSAPIEQYVACTNSSGKINVLLYTCKCPDWSKSPDFVKRVEAVVDEFRSNCQNQYMDWVTKDKSSDKIEFLSMGNKFVVSVYLFKYKAGGEMSFMAMTSDIESLADREARLLASGAKGVLKQWASGKKRYPADYVKLVEDKAARLSRKNSSLLRQNWDGQNRDRPQRVGKTLRP